LARFLLKPAIVIAAGLLVGCVAPVPERGEQVSLRVMLAENRDKPFACNIYKSDTDSCGGLSQYHLRGSKGIETGRLALRGMSESYVEAIIPFEERAEGICTDGAKARFSIKGSAPSSAQWGLKIVRDALRKQGVLCNTYYRAVGGGYIVVTKNSQGKIPYGGEVHLRFFSAPKALRPL